MLTHQWLISLIDVNFWKKKNGLEFGGNKNWLPGSIPSHSRSWWDCPPPWTASWGSDHHDPEEPAAFESFKTIASRINRQSKCLLIVQNPASETIFRQKYLTWKFLAVSPSSVQHEWATRLTFGCRSLTWPTFSPCIFSSSYCTPCFSSPHWQPSKKANISVSPDQSCRFLDVVTRRYGIPKGTTGEQGERMLRLG